MPRFDASTAECLVFTFKEGLLSPIAHDLQLRVTELTLTIDDETRAIDARFDPRSLRVVCTMRGGAPVPGTPSNADKQDIERNIARDVLDVERYSEIRFTSTSVTPEGDRQQIRGTLLLHGQTREIATTAWREGDAYVAEVRLHQPDFGIRPYRAMMGTLRVQADVVVRIRVPAR
jgi:hypothetical protein